MRRQEVLSRLTGMRKGSTVTRNDAPSGRDDEAPGSEAEALCAALRAEFEELGVRLPALMPLAGSGTAESGGPSLIWLGVCEAAVGRLLLEALQGVRSWRLEREGACVVDTRSGRVGRVMGQVGPHLQVRPLPGGREWSCPPEYARVAEEWEVRHADLCEEAVQHWPSREGRGTPSGSSYLRMLPSEEALAARIFGQQARPGGPERPQ